MTDTFEKQLTDIITEYESGLSKSGYYDASDIFASTQITDLQVRCIAAIVRASGSNSLYQNMAKEISTTNDHVYDQVPKQIGVAKALLSDIQNGYMKSFEELVHSNVFSDFLEMADYLLEKGYKDAAAVLAGSTLEVHLKKLCNKNGVNIISNGKSKKADSLNAELRKQGVYALLEQKSITAWLDLRNNAAHGNYANYDENQVRGLVTSIRDYIIRHPA